MRRPSAVLSVVFAALSIAWCAASGRAASNPSAVSAPTLDPVEYYRMRAEAQRLQNDGQDARAAETYERLVATYDGDGFLWLNLGECRAAQRRFADAITAYRRAYALGVWTHAQVARQIARCFAQGGQPDSALAWLERASSDGFEQRGNLAQDSAFAALRDDPRLRRLAGLPPDRSMTREEGWRYDLDDLVAEVKRYHYVYRWKPLPPEFQSGLVSLRERIPQLSDAGVMLGIQRLMVMLGDGHTTLYPVGERVMLKPAPIALKRFADGVFVIDAPDSAAAWRGARIERIGATPIAEVLRRLEPYVSRDNLNGPDVIGPYFAIHPLVLKELGLVPTADRLPLVGVAPGGRRLEGAFAAGNAGEPHIPKLAPALYPGAPEPPLYLRRIADPYWFETLPGDSVLYLQFNQVANARDESLREFALRLRRQIDEHATRVLIVDVRHNNGGNGNLLTPLLRTLIHFETTRPAPRLFVITGPYTFSAAQMFIAEVDRLTNAVFVGEPSGSRPSFVGEDTGLRLPWSGIYGSISSRLHAVNAAEERTWIPPDLPVSATGADWLAGRDAALEAVLRVVRGNAAN